MAQNIGATAAFSLLAGTGALLFSTDMSLLASLFSVITVSVAGGLIGRAMWWVFVDSLDKWSIPVRGVVAGAFTGWLSIFPAATILINLSQYSSLSEFVGSFSSLNALLEFAFGIVVFGLLGTVFVGWITIPIAAIVGYVVGRNQQGGGDSEELEGSSHS
jgi:hypothetical protein